MAWRPATFTTEQRLAAAREILRRLQDRYGRGLLALAVEGSTAKGLDRPESDLECCAVVRSDEQHRWYAGFYRGMFVGVSIVSPEQALRDAQEVDDNWPVVGDRLWTAQVLHDPTGLYGRLREAAAEARADFAALEREALADMYEHVYKLCTLPLAGDGDGFAAMTATHEAAQVAFWAADAVGLAHRHRYLSSRTMFAESAALPSLPREYGVHLEGLLGPGARASERRDHAGALWAAFLPWAGDRGVRLDDDLARL